MSNMDQPDDPVGVAADPQVIAFAGDWHSNTDWAQWMIDKAAAAGVQTIVHTGDFLYRFAPVYLHVLTETLTGHGMNLLFVDGNHEDFDTLYGPQYPIGPDGRRQITPAIHHLPRGYRWQWGGIRFAACGGGVSVDRDKAHRVPHVSWWPQEEISEQDVAACVAGGPADVLISHDCPSGVQIPDLRKTSWRWSRESLAASEAHREQLTRVCEGVRPRMVVHGHYDRCYVRRVRRPWGMMRVVGLDRDGSSFDENMAVCDISSLRLALGRKGTEPVRGGSS